MKRIWKMCEYGIPALTVQRIEMINLENLKEDFDATLEKFGISGFGVKRKQEILEVLNNDEFWKSDYRSVYALIPYGLEAVYADKLFNNDIDVTKIDQVDFNALGFQRVIQKKIDKILAENIIDYSEEIPEKIYIDKSNELLSLIKLYLEPDERISLVALKNRISNCDEYPINNYMEDVNRLFVTGKLHNSMDGVYYSVPSIVDLVGKFNRTDNAKAIIMSRLEGKTLQEVADEFGITRERVRQIVTKNLDSCEAVKEDRYRKIFQTYNLSLDEFKIITGQNSITYYYLDLKYQKGDKDVALLIDDEDIDENLQTRLMKEKGYVYAFGKLVDKKRTTLFKEYVRHKLYNPMRFKELVNDYNEWIMTEFNFDGGKYDDSISVKNKLVSNDDLIYDSDNNLFRYYDYAGLEVSHIKSLNEMLNVEPGEYSTMLFFNENKQLMDEIDIRNEYELHFLLKRLDIKGNNEIFEFSRTPHLLIGITDKKQFFLEKIQELAPENVKELAKFFEETYGHKFLTAATYISTTFHAYIKDDVVEFDVDKITNEQKEKLLERFNFDMTSISNAKDIFNVVIGKDSLKYFNSYNLSLLGFRNRTGYVIRNTIKNLQNYMKDFIKNKKIIRYDEIPIVKSMVMTNILRSMEVDYDIIKYNKEAYITFETLAGAGITKNDLKDYSNAALKCYEENEFFSLEMLRKDCGELKLDDLGFNNEFYESILIANPKIRKVIFNNQPVFYIYDGVTEKFKKDLLISILESVESIDTFDLMDLLKTKYHVVLDGREDITFIVNNTDLYYCKSLDKVYLNKSIYIDELYGGNEDGND